MFIFVPAIVNVFGTQSWAETIAFPKLVKYLK